MSFKEVQTLDADNTIAIGGFNKKTKRDNPTSAEGYFLGTRMVDSPKSKSGKAALHFLQTPKGNLGVWGKTDMDRKLSSVAPGTMIRISFDKMVPTPNGEMYKFKVEVDSSNTIEVSASPTASYEVATSDDDDTSAGYGAESSDDDEDPYEAQEAVQASALSALERKQKVEALLKGKGRTNNRT